MSFRLPSADGIVFDFNGTLFLDEKENRESWDAISTIIRKRALTDEEFALFNGRTDKDMIRFLIPTVSDAESDVWSERKEDIYKKLCIKNNTALADGAEALFRYAIGKGIKIAIASSAPKINMDWYIPRFHLLDYFSPSSIIAGRDDIPSKPDGTIFRLALEAIGVSGERAIAFEDSEAGVKSALDAGIKYVYRIKAPGKESIREPRLTEITSFLDLYE